MWYWSLHPYLKVNKINDFIFHWLLAAPERTSIHRRDNQFMDHWAIFMLDDSLIASWSFEARPTTYNIGNLNYRITLKFERRLIHSSTEMPLKFQCDHTNLNAKRKAIGLDVSTWYRNAPIPVVELIAQFWNLLLADACLMCAIHTNWLKVTLWPLRHRMQTEFWMN